MRSQLKKLNDSLINMGKEGFLLLVLSFGFFVACQGALEDETPFGPSTTTLRIVPNTANVAAGVDLTLTPLGGTAPFSWTSSNLDVATIVVNTGVATGGTIQGNSTITVVDAVGNTATATLTLPGLPLTFDNPGATQPLASTDDVITVTANGSGAGFTTSISNNNTGSAFTLLPTIVSTGVDLTITSPATLPTAVQGDQTFTITVTDISNSNTGTLTYLLLNDGT